MLLQFLSAPEDGRKKRPKHVEHYCTAKLHHVGSLCILTYDARKLKHKKKLNFLFDSNTKFSSNLLRIFGDEIWGWEYDLNITQ